MGKQETAPARVLPEDPGARRGAGKDALGAALEPGAPAPAYEHVMVVFAGKTRQFLCKPSSRLAGGTSKAGQQQDPSASSTRGGVGCSFVLGIHHPSCRNADSLVELQREAPQSYHHTPLGSSASEGTCLSQLLWARWSQC